MIAQSDANAGMITFQHGGSYTFDGVTSFFTDQPHPGQALFFLLGAMAIRGRNVLLVLVTNSIVGGLLLSALDGKSLAEGQDLAFITACTIGYGDLTPETWGARLVSIAIGFHGLLPTGAIIALSVRALEMGFREELEKIERIYSGGADQKDRE